MTFAGGRAPRRDLSRLGRETGERVLTAVERLAAGEAAGEGDVKRLSGVRPPLFRLRVGDYRILFRYEQEAILIERVLPRDKAYR